MTDSSPHQAIWTLAVKLLDSPLAEDKWKGVIEIEATATLEDLHVAIQDAVEFENDHMYEFYIAATPKSGDRRTYSVDDGNIFKTTISQVFPLESGTKLFYWFDFGDDWLFEVSQSRTPPHAAIEGEHYPQLIDEMGTKPIQYPDFDQYDDDEDDENDDDHY
jgi:hypothetical protein